jgi:hypothetical protein
MQNALRHKMRCWNYLNLGMYQHACGSFRKFHRNQVNAFSITTPYKRALDILADNVANTILNGSN